MNSLMVRKSAIPKFLTGVDVKHQVWVEGTINSNNPVTGACKNIITGKKMLARSLKQSASSIDKMSPSVTSWIKLR